MSDIKTILDAGDITNIASKKNIFTTENTGLSILDESIAETFSNIVAVDLGGVDGINSSLDFNKKIYEQPKVELGGNMTDQSPDNLVGNKKSGLFK